MSKISKTEPGRDSSPALALGKPASLGGLALLTTGALGIVYGDIGTSPLYTLPVCFAAGSGIPPDPQFVLGVVSLIIWSLVIVVSVKYLAVILRADLHGEGGILALTTLVTSSQRQTAASRWLLPLGLFGAALLLGDGMITPAVSVLSALEGIEVIKPAFGHVVVPTCVVVLILLFLAQRSGTEKIGRWFGPIMLCWFVSLAALGIRGICLEPKILLALNPWEGMHLIASHTEQAIVALGFVFLAVTGGEALYADLGHFGRRPIRSGWFAVVFPALLLNYLGQGGLVLDEPKLAAQSFFRLAPEWLEYPLVGLATVATVIASQSILSGAFSLVHQARQFQYVPRLKVIHYSGEGEGKVYVPFVNWCLAVATILLVLAFRSSAALAGAYGMAVSGTMLFTTVLVVPCFRGLWKWSWPATLALAALFLAVDSTFVIANLAKLLAGGWIPLVVAVAIYLVMTTWRQGRSALEQARYVPASAITKLREDVDSGKLVRVPGIAVYFSSDPTGVPATLLVNAEHNHVLHQLVVLLTIDTQGVPRVAQAQRLESTRPAPGFLRLVAHYGFMQSPDVPAIISQAMRQGILPDEPLTYFIRSEEILPTGTSRMPRWRKRLYAFLNRNSQDATSVWGIPPRQAVGLRISTKL